MRNSVDFRSYGAVPGLTASATSKTTIAFEKWADSGDDLELPAAGDFYLESMTPPPRSIRGAGHEVVGLVAASGFAARSDTFFDLSAVVSPRQVFEGFKINAAQQCGVALGVDANGASTAGSRHIYSRLYLQGGTTSQVFFVAPTASEGSVGVGSHFDHCRFESAGDSRLIDLRKAADDIKFTLPRCLNSTTASTVSPINIDVAINTIFKGLFYANIADTGASLDHIIRIVSGAGPIKFEGGFIELAHLTYSNLKYIVEFTSGRATIEGLLLENGPTMPSGAAFASVAATTNDRRLKVEGVTNQLTNMNDIFALNTSDAGGSGHFDLHAWGNEGFSGDVAVAHPSAATTNRKTVAHLTGSHDGENFDDNVSHDGTDLLLARKARVRPSVSTKTASYTAKRSDVFTQIRMNVGAVSTLTIPPTSSEPFEIGAELDVFNKASDACTLTAGSGVTLNGTAALAQNESATLKHAGSDEWDIHRG